LGSSEITHLRLRDVDFACEDFPTDCAPVRLPKVF
jgi:hypothetical protein